MNWPAFANPLLLTGMAAVGLPLLIHWLTRARPRRIAFPPCKFLVEACAGQQAVDRLRTFLLLAIRCLLALALALLFAQPFLKPRGAAAGVDSNRRVVLILDASLSMRAVPQGVPLFARAQAQAAEVLRSLPAGSEAAVILEGATPQPLLPALSGNLPALHERLVKSQATFECGDPGAALALAQKLLAGPGTIYVFSDFQKSNWEPVGGLPGGAVCRLFPVTAGAVDNTAITAARLMPAAPVAGEPVEVTCSVFNSSGAPREETVRLELGEFARWFCEVMLDQVAFMTSMLEIDGLQERVEKYVLGDLGLSDVESAIAKDVLVRGEVARGEAARITGLSERAARDALARLLDAGLLASATPKGPVSLRVSTTAAESLFPRLF